MSPMSKVFTIIWIHIKGIIYILKCLTFVLSFCVSRALKFDVQDNSKCRLDPKNFFKTILFFTFVEITKLSP